MGCFEPVSSEAGSADVDFRVARWFIFKPKTPNLGKFLRALDWKMLTYFMAICNILRAFGKFYDH
jgi:hypothetical protein